MSRGAVCHGFVQNAWRRELCANCFHARTEHLVAPQHSPQPKNNHTAAPKTGILATNRRPAKNNDRNVRFPEEVCSVIGYGGDGWSDDEDEEAATTLDNDNEEPFPETAAERELQRLTRANTDFNTVKANLLSDSTKSYTSLLLGKAQTDTDGKKKTLLVSVTPFGQDKSQPVKSHVRKPFVVPVANTESRVEEVSNYRTKIILTNYTKVTEMTCSENLGETDGICVEKSLLEEISETLEQNLLNNNSDLQLSPTETDCKPSEADEKIKESMSDESDKKDTSEAKKNSLARKSPVPKTQERPKVNLSRSEFKFCKINVDCSSVDSATSTLNSTADSSLTSDDEGFNGKTDSENDDSGHFSDPHKCEETVKIKLFTETNKNIKLSPIGNHRKLSGQVSGGGYSTFQAPILDMPTITPKPTDAVFSADASRELAGEPDGRADPDDTEPPALPTSPVPSMDPRPSFLHSLPSPKPAVPDKPKLPVKPVIKPISKKLGAPRRLSTTKADDDISKVINDEKSNEITEVHEDKAEPIYYAQPVLTKQDSDTSLASSPNEEHSNLYQRNPHFTKSDSPVVRELEKRERLTMISQPRPRQCEDGTDTAKDVPEPAPRRNISLSHDNLLIEEKRKGKYKFSIKKLLRIGSSKDLDRKEPNVATVGRLACKTEEIYDLVPKPKPRLVIIHPLDMHSAEVTEEAARAKPPPPPRLTAAPTSPSDASRPARPPPPRSAALLHKQKHQAWNSSPNTDNIYANLGEVRSAIAPRKPERTASMRERDTALQPRRERAEEIDRDGEGEGEEEGGIVQATNETLVAGYADSDYEDVASAPECDSNGRGRYCGSETESELYAPCSCEGDGLRVRRHRSVLHRSLEDNYGAVVVANHEALAQVLEQVNAAGVSSPTCGAARALRAAGSLRWAEFGAGAVSLGGQRRACVAAAWGGAPVTLLATRGLCAGLHPQPPPHRLVTLAEFTDLVPATVFGEHETDEHIQATVVVLGAGQVCSVAAYGAELRTGGAARRHEALFAALQAVSALSAVRADSLSADPAPLLVLRDRSPPADSAPQPEQYARLCVLQGLSEAAQEEEGERLSLCACALKAVEELLNDTEDTDSVLKALQGLLSSESAASLSVARSVLELALWGPAEELAGAGTGTAAALQRWLDLERATLLQGLVRVRSTLPPYDHLRLAFLVSTTARALAHAMTLLDTGDNTASC